MVYGHEFAAVYPDNPIPIPIPGRSALEAQIRNCYSGHSYVPGWAVSIVITYPDTPANPSKIKQWFIIRIVRGNGYIRVFGWIIYFYGAGYIIRPGLDLDRVSGGDFIGKNVLYGSAGRGRRAATRIISSIGCYIPDTGGVCGWG